MVVRAADVFEDCSGDAFHEGETEPERGEEGWGVVSSRLSLPGRARSPYPASSSVACDGVHL